jgi:hypothetical protein
MVKTDHMDTGGFTARQEGKMQSRWLTY